MSFNSGRCQCALCGHSHMDINKVFIIHTNYSRVPLQHGQIHIRHVLQNVNKTPNSQQPPHTSPSRASYGVSVIRVWEKINRVITAPHCIRFFSIGIYNPHLMCLIYQNSWVPQFNFLLGRNVCKHVRGESLTDSQARGNRQIRTQVGLWTSSWIQGQVGSCMHPGVHDLWDSQILYDVIDG